MKNVKIKYPLLAEGNNNLEYSLCTWRDLQRVILRIYNMCRLDHCVEQAGLYGKHDSLRKKPSAKDGDKAAAVEHRKPDAVKDESDDNGAQQLCHKAAEQRRLFVIQDKSVDNACNDRAECKAREKGARRSCDVSGDVGYASYNSSQKRSEKITCESYWQGVESKLYYLVNGDLEESKDDGQCGEHGTGGEYTNVFDL